MEQEQKTDTEERVPFKRRKNGRNIMFGLAILVCGILIGFGIMLLLMRYNYCFFRKYRRPRITVIVKRMERDLGLNKEQREEVIKILRKREGEIRPVMDAEFKKTDELIKKVLSDEQWKKWEEIQKERRNRKKKSNQSFSDPQKSSQ